MRDVLSTVLIKTAADSFSCFRPSTWHRQGHAGNPDLSRGAVKIGAWRWNAGDLGVSYVLGRILFHDIYLPLRNDQSASSHYLPGVAAEVIVSGTWTVSLRRYDLFAYFLNITELYRLGILREAV